MAEHAERFLLAYLSDEVDCHVVDGVLVHYPLGTPLWASGVPFEGIVPETYEVGRHSFHGFNAVAELKRGVNGLFDGSGRNRFHGFNAVAELKRRPRHARKS